jgi:DNA (cytosine-5)-methyltransferase 1
MSSSEHLFPYEWKLADGYPAKGIQYHGCKVFGTFICGGGSSMGYKLAGYEHLGGVELDAKVAATYKANHYPKYLYNMDIRDFNELSDLPAELYNLDILDGSPPCSTFSMAGSREGAWGKEKKFAEGQKKQTLDDLVFTYCNTIEKLKPKVCWLENVSGLLKGNAKAYAKEIVKRITDIGYRVQVFLLDASTMGVPQHRERCFFIGLRNDYELPRLVLNFNEKPIIFGECQDDEDKGDINKLPAQQKLIFLKKKKGDKYFKHVLMREEGRNSGFGQCIFSSNIVSPTITHSCVNNSLLFDYPRHLNNKELMRVSTFPQDYKADNLAFVCGMSVPPVMAAQIANQIYIQWLSKIN